MRTSEDRLVVGGDPKELSPAGLLVQALVLQPLVVVNHRVLHNVPGQRPVPSIGSAAKLAEAI